MTAAAIEAHGVSPWRARAGLAVVCLGTLVAPLDSAVNIALPSITTAFGADLSAIRWVVIAYVLTYSSLLLIFGKIGDLASYRAVFQAGLAMSTLGFLGCTLASTYPMLLAGRVAQGVGIALTLSCAPALATTLFPESRRTRVLGIYAATTAAGAALGPIVGGALVEIFGWSVVFAMRMPLTVVALCLTPLIPDRRAPSGKRGFDWIGAALLVGWLVALLLALALRSDIATAPIRLAMAAAGALLLVLFVVHEQRHPEPIIRPSLFRDAEFALMNVISIVVNFAAFSILLLVPYFLVRHAALGPGSGGFVLALAGIGAVLGASLAGRLADRVGIGRLALLGVVLSASGLALISRWSADSGLAVIAASMLLQGLGVGLFQVAYTDLVTAILPVSDRGVAGSLTMVTRTIGVVAGASGHSALHAVLEDRARLLGASPEAAFIAGFQGAFTVATLAVASCLLLSLAKARMWNRRSA